MPHEPKQTFFTVEPQDRRRFEGRGQFRASPLGKDCVQRRGNERMLSATIYYSIITKDYAKTLANTAADPTVARETAYFQANIGKVKSVNDLLNNSQLYNYVKKAFGLSDMQGARGWCIERQPRQYVERSSLQGARHNLRFCGEWSRDDEFKLPSADDDQQF